jgi:biotin-(acetyl-CoA carboxylase) ligase
MNSLDLIPTTQSLGLEIKKQDAKEKIVERITQLKLTDPKYKFSQDLLLLVCNLTEHIIKDKKINKKEIVLDIYALIFALNATERVTIETQIEFLHSNKAIKKLSRFYLFCCSTYEYLFKGKKKP